MKAGSLIVFTTGEYSDYSFIDHFLVLQDIPKEKIAEIEREVRKREAQSKEALNPYVVFISLLIREGFLLSISVTEYHLGSYGKLELQGFFK